MDIIVEDTKLKRKSSEKLINISNHMNRDCDKKVVKKIEDINGNNSKKKIISVNKKSNNRNEKSPIRTVEKSYQTLSREKSNKNLEDKSKSPYKISNSKFVNKKM